MITTLKQHALAVLIAFGVGLLALAFYNAIGWKTEPWARPLIAASFAALVVPTWGTARLLLSGATPKSFVRPMLAPSITNAIVILLSMLAFAELGWLSEPALRIAALVAALGVALASGLVIRRVLTGKWLS